MRRFPDARRSARVCGGGANGGDGRIALEVLRAAGREAQRGRSSGDVLIDALFGTGFHGEPRPEAAALIEELNAAGRPVVAVDLPSGVTRTPARSPAAAVRARRDRDDARAARSASRSRRGASTPAKSSSPTSASSRGRPTTRLVTQEILGARPAEARARQQVHRGRGSRRRRLAGDDRRGLRSPRRRLSAPTPAT